MKRLIVSPDVFLWASTNYAIAYHSGLKSGFRLSLNDTCKRLLSVLLAPESLYSVLLVDDAFMVDRLTADFIKQLLDSGYAKMVDDNENQPLSIMPILKIQDDVAYYRWLNRQGIDGSVINNLHRIVVNLGDNNGDTIIASQTLYPDRSNGIKMNWDKLKKFIALSTVSDYLSEVVIVGITPENIDTTFFDAAGILTNIKFYIFDKTAEDCVFCNLLRQYGEIVANIRLSKLLDEDTNSILQNSSYFNEIIVLVESIDDFDRLEAILDSYSLCNIFPMPIYNGRNIEFIRSALSYPVTGLLINGPDRRNIFIHQSMNVFNFGNLYINYDGCVRPSLCAEALGTICDNPKALVQKEFEVGNTWLGVRSFDSCKHCEFRWLCPCPSPIELLIQSTLCKIAE